MDGPSTRPDYSSFFTRIEPVTDSTAHLRRHLYGLLFARMVLFTLLFGLTTMLEAKGQRVMMPQITVVLAYLSLIYIFSLGSVALLQITTRHLVKFGLLQLMADVLFIALLVYGTGASRSLFTPAFILPVLSGGLLLYRQGGLVPAAFATLLYGLLLLLEYQGYLPLYLTGARSRPQDGLTLVNLFAFYGGLFFLAALLSGLLSSRLRTTEDALSRTTLEYDRLTQLYKQIFEDISTGIITLDEMGRITSFNRASERITGHPQASVVLQEFQRTFPEFQLTMEGRQVIDFQTLDGRNIRIGYSCSSLNLPGESIENTLTGTDCRLITLQDISQLEHMERQIRESEKMAAIGEMSASIAHEFRNPLASISGSAQILAMDYTGTDQESTQQSLVEIILRESNRMARTINEFLQFARPRKPERELCRVEALAVEAITLVNGGNSRYPACLIQVDIDRNLTCAADHGQLLTILVHLLENSCAASVNCAQPVRISAQEEEGGKTVIIHVRDEGEGIRSEDKEKIFQPFFTTRTDGSGLGLAIVQLLCHLHHGRLQVVSEPGKGCQVSLILPQDDPSTSPA